jgi:hypothetical protein
MWVAWCWHHGSLFFTHRVSSMRPLDFGTDALQRQLASAVESGDEAAVVAAIKAGADANAIGNGGFRVLYWAMARGNLAGFELLLKYGASLQADYRDVSHLPDQTYRDTVLEQVVGATDVSFLETTLRNGLDPNYVRNPEDAMTLLFEAVARQSIPAIKILAAAGADIDHREISGYTPLIVAAMGRNYSEAWALMTSGADPTIKDNLGHDFVWLLKQYGTRGVRPDDHKSFESIVEELVKRGLLTHQDIINADKPKPVQPGFEGNPPGITVIEHSPDSEAGRAILELDRLEREANERDRGTR